MIAYSMFEITAWARWAMAIPSPVATCKFIWFQNQARDKSIYDKLIVSYDRHSNFKTRKATCLAIFILNLHIISEYIGVYQIKNED